MADTVYIATLTQTSTSAPVATELVNSLGALVWTRASSGVYVGTLAAAFTPVADSSIELPLMTNITSAVVTSVNAVTITATGDGVLTAREVRILVSTHYSSFLAMELRISRSILAQMANDTANATIADPAVIESILTDTDALIEAKLGVLYTVPFTTVPDIIRKIATDLSVYDALQRRPANMPMPKEWTKINDDAIALLESIATGEFNLPTTATLAVEGGVVETLETDKLVDFNDSDNGMSDF